MKKLIFAMSVLTTLILITPVPAHANDIIAVKTELVVSVDGRTRSVDAYAIDNYNYFKLRDLAYMLSGTSKQFEVTWDGSKNTIKIISGKSYTPVGNELVMLPYWEKQRQPFRIHQQSCLTATKSDLPHTPLTATIISNFVI